MCEAATINVLGHESTGARAGPLMIGNIYTEASTLNTHAHAQKPQPKPSQNPANIVYNLSKLMSYLSYLSRSTQSNLGKTYVYLPEATAPDLALTSRELTATSPDGTALMATTGELRRTQGRRIDS